MEKRRYEVSGERFDGDDNKKLWFTIGHLAFRTLYYQTVSAVKSAGPLALNPSTFSPVRMNNASVALFPQVAAISLHVFLCIIMSLCLWFYM